MSTTLPVLSPTQLRGRVEEIEADTQSLVDLMRTYEALWYTLAQNSSHPSANYADLLDALTQARRQRDKLVNDLLALRCTPQVRAAVGQPPAYATAAWDTTADTLTPNAGVPFLPSLFAAADLLEASGGYSAATPANSNDGLLTVTSLSGAGVLDFVENITTIADDHTTALTLRERLVEEDLATEATPIQAVVTVAGDGTLTTPAITGLLLGFVYIPGSWDAATDIKIELTSLGTILAEATIDGTAGSNFFFHPAVRCPSDTITITVTNGGAGGILGSFVFLYRPDVP